MSDRKRMNQRISMAMVAARAGVSGQTVSRVVNGSPRVDPATRARVEQAMADLGYRPNRAARTLRTGRSRTIGVVAQTLASVDTSGKLHAVVEVASMRGYAVTVASVGDGGDLGDVIRHLEEQGADGIVVLNTALRLTADLRSAGVPIVAVEAAPDDGFDVVGTDNFAGGALATVHLRDAGHAVVHHLAGPRDSYAAMERERGWRSIQPAAPEPFRGDWSAAAGYEQGRVLAADPKVTAVFVANDQMALGVLRALAENGRRVPDDVAVVGFDDVAEAANYRPPLTTVRQDLTRIGADAVEALIGLLDGGERMGSRLRPPILVQRTSSHPR